MTNTQLASIIYITRNARDRAAKTPNTKDLAQDLDLILLALEVEQGARENHRYWAAHDRHPPQ